MSYITCVTSSFNNTILYIHHTQRGSNKELKIFNNISTETNQPSAAPIHPLTHIQTKAEYTRLYPMHEENDFLIALILVSDVIMFCNVSFYGVYMCTVYICNPNLCSKLFQV